MNYSLTLIGLAVAVIGRLGQNFGVQTDSVTVENLQTIIPVVMQIVGIIVAYVGRVRKGDISLIGFRVPPR